MLSRSALLQVGAFWIAAGFALGADQRCATCHPKETAGYATSAMGRSLSTTADQPAGSFEHATSDTKFTIQTEAGVMTQSFERPAEKSSQKVAYVIGSGAHAFGFLVQIGDYLFQSPLSYYSARKIWDMAPGYENASAPDFSRPVTPECLLCHAGKIQPVADTVNRYQTPPILAEGITCERCHGDAQAHLRKPVPGSILNPAKLTNAARDSVCEQCHLAGEVRIPNPGKSISDFRPGETLEASFTVFVGAQTPGNTVKVISHAEQLALSACARNSGGKLWCGTCHDPHDQPAQPAAYFRERCLGCHGATLAEAHAAPDRDCISCHMPRLGARDGGHTAFTDHWIRRRPADSSVSAEVEDLKAWREPAAGLRDRNQAIALVTVGLQNSSSAEVIQGYRLLNRVVKTYGDDPAVLSSLGTVLLRAKEPAEALKQFQKAAQLKPAYAPYRVNVALAMIALGRKTDAAQQLEKALDGDPLLPPAIELLSGLYRDMGESAKAAALKARYQHDMGIVASK